MKKLDLVRLLAAEAGTTQAAAKAVLDALPGVVLTIARAGTPVRLASLGTFRVVERPARKSRNPQTGEPVLVPERRVLAFRAERGLRKGV
ncbi:MAG: HU family DNA-binding protein [Peptococcaceae bacterium]|nr:HU family DNA-binding protein [Peptococcaceae bacterium]